MPAQYAHYRFGAQLLSQLPADIRRTCQRFRQIYDMGLHGPDIFFYHNIFFTDSAVSLGRNIHRQTGEEFFTRICKRLRLEPTEAGRAYLYGVLAHYCLDSLCHPFIHEHTGDGKIGHSELEKEFDRHLLVLDGKRPPHTFDFSPHMKLTPGECETVAQFYSSATPIMVRSSVQNMAAVTKFLASPQGFRRNTLNVAIKITGKKFSQQLIPRSPNRKCEHLDAPMTDLFNGALALYPVLLDQIQAHMDHNEPLGEEFQKTFG